MFRQNVVAVFLGSLIVACASTTTIVSLSPRDPADPAAPEAATPPLTTGLKSGAPESGAAPAAPEVNRTHEHDPTVSPDVYYTCPMHPTVKQATPGKCPICGMALVQQETKRPQLEARR